MSKLTDALEGARPALKAEFDRLAADGEAECRAAIAEAVAILALFPDLARAQEAAELQRAVEWLNTQSGYSLHNATAHRGVTAHSNDYDDYGGHGPTIAEAVAALRLKLQGEQA